jgi:hypothetical protein
MKRIFSSVFFASAIAIAAAACDSGDDGYGEIYGGGYGYCAGATTCGACTPLNGCGWCFNADGTGTCTSSPDECTTPEFSWTWDPSGCRETADAGVVVPDAGASLLDGATQGDAASPTDDGATIDAPAESSATP